MDYKVQAVQEVGDKDQYGNQAYSVKFAEVADTVFMKAQKAPVEGGTEHGVITDETSKAGKPYKRFKRVAKENFNPTQFKSKEDPGKQDSIMRMNALTNAVAFSAIENLNRDATMDNAEIFYKWLSRKPVEAKDIPELKDMFDEPNFE